MKLWDGKQISEAGVYKQIPMAAYHGDLCVGPSISSGGIRTMWNQSPKHYYQSSYLNPQRSEGDNPAFAIGRAAHKLLIEGRSGFDEEFAVRPTQWADWRTAAAKEWREEQINAGKTVITMDDVEAIGRMAQALGEHPLVRAGILDGMIERSLVWKDEETNVWVKARPDAMPDVRTLSDLKTTASVDDDNIRRTLRSFGYHVQGGVAAEGVKATVGEEIQDFTLVFVEKSPPYAVRIVTIPPEDIERGRQQMRWALREFAKCVASNQWPGPGISDAEFIGLGDFERRRIDDRLASLMPAQEQEIYERTKSQ
jgi:hypothetical protein